MAEREITRHLSIEVGRGRARENGLQVLKRNCTTSRLVREDENGLIPLWLAVRSPLNGTVNQDSQPASQRESGNRAIHLSLSLTPQHSAAQWRQQGARVLLEVGRAAEGPLYAGVTL